MKERDRTSERLLAELPELRQRITELEALRNKHKRSEEAFRSLKKAVETMQLGVTITDAKGKIIYTNSAEARMHGYDVEELIGEDVRVFASRNKWDPMTLEQMKKIKSWRRESTNKRKDGSTFPVQLMSDVVMNVSGEPIGIVTTCEDITNRKKMEEELLKAKKLESLGILAGGIAHDFNNLLVVILGYISLAKMFVSEDKIIKLLTDSENVSLKARDLANKLLTFSKGEKPLMKTMSIKKLIKDSATVALSGSNVTCEFSMPDDLWSVKVDELQMSQVIHNIVINAREGSQEVGTIKIRVENINEEADDITLLKKGTYIKIAIEDNGVGIPEENLSKIFDPYFTTKEMGAQKGRGLGLATAYSIIKNHHGVITVESRIGVGTTFYIYLPASKKEIPSKKDKSFVY